MEVTAGGRTRHRVRRLPPVAGTGHRLVVVDPTAEGTDGRFRTYRWPPIEPRPGWLALAVPVELTSGAPWLANGWQSWSSATSTRVGAGTAAAAPPAPGIAPRRPVDLPVVEGTGSWDVVRTDGLVAGVRTGEALLVARPAEGRLLVLAEGAGPLPEVLVTATSDEADADRALVELLERCRAAAPSGRKAVAPPSVWCTWGGRWQGSAGGGRGGGELIDQDQLAAALPRLGTLAARGQLHTAQIDDGWQRAIGDWIAGPSFPAGLAGLAHLVADAGLAPGLWWAPACAAPGSAVATAHPEWVLREDDGRPVVAATVPHWGGAVWALDVTRPDVLDHLAETSRRLEAHGFRYQKLDFLYAATLPGCRARPWSGGTALRALLTAVRTGAPDTFVLGCGAPLWPSVGLVDGLRIGPDITAVWDPPVPGGLLPGQQAGLRSALEALRHRQFLHGHLWVNDGDHLLLRDDDVPAGWPAQARFARAVGASGTLLAFADRPDEIGPRGWALWEALTAARRRQIPADQCPPTPRPTFPLSA